MKGICPGHVLHICFVYKLQWKSALTMDMLGTVHKWKPNVTDMIWRCLGTAIAMPNTMETRAQEPWSDYSCFFPDRASKSNQQNILKKDQTKAGHERGQNEVRTRYQTRSKTTRDRPLPNPGAGRFSASANSCSGIRSSKNEKNKYRSNPNGDKMIPWNISVYIVYTTLSCLNPGQCW